VAPEGRSFSPAAGGGVPPSFSLASRAVPQARDCAGGEGKRGGTPPIAAGLKPCPSGASGEPPCAGEKSGFGTVRGTPGFAQKIKNRGNEAKESLETKEVRKTRCAKRTQICARKPANEAKKATFRCKSGTSAGGVRPSQVKSPPTAHRITGIGKAQTCQRAAVLRRARGIPLPRPSTHARRDYPEMSGRGASLRIEWLSDPCTVGRSVGLSIRRWQAQRAVDHLGIWAPRTWQLACCFNHLFGGEDE